MVGWTFLEGLLGWAENFARYVPVLGRSCLKGPRNIQSCNPYCSGPRLLASLLVSGGLFSHGSCVLEEVLGWADIFARYSPVYVRIFLEGPHNVLS